MVPYSITFLYPVVLIPFNVFYTYSWCWNTEIVLRWSSLNFWHSWHIHILSHLCLNWKNTFLLLSWLKIQHSGGWHAAQLATSVYSLLDIGRGKHFHPHRLPPAFHEWNWRQSLSSQFSLVKTHRLGTLNPLDYTRLFWKGYLSLFCFAISWILTVRNVCVKKALIRSNQMGLVMHWCVHLEFHYHLNSLGDTSFPSFLGCWKYYYLIKANTHVEMCVCICDTDRWGLQSMSFVRLASLLFLLKP